VSLRERITRPSRNWQGQGVSDEHFGPPNAERDKCFLRAIGRMELVLKIVARRRKDSAIGKVLKFPRRSVHVIRTGCRVECGQSDPQLLSTSGSDSGLGSGQGETIQTFM
jgi:hypothetical protein